MNIYRCPSRMVAAWFALAVFAVGLRAGAQQNPIPPTRQLGARLAVSHDSLGDVSGIRQLSDGGVLVNDQRKRQLRLYDSTLSRSVVVADSIGDPRSAYGSGMGSIIPFAGDSTYFVDAVALAMLVIDPHGAIVRVVSPPVPVDVGSLVLFGTPAFDARGRVVYRPSGVDIMPGGGMSIHGKPRKPAGADANAQANDPAPFVRDSSAVIRADMGTHAIDTVGFVMSQVGQPTNFVQLPDGNSSVIMHVNPIPLADAWGVAFDGSVAFVRALDYHIDWVNADGTKSSTPKIAHDWQRLSDSAKTAIVDSVQRIYTTRDSTTDAARAKGDSLATATGRPPSSRQIQHTVVVAASDLVDYRPPFASNSGYDPTVRADAEDNLWIKQPTNDAAHAPAVYDIVNRQGRLIDRVQLPPSMALAGFGPGVVYLTSREGWGIALVKYRIR